MKVASLRSSLSCAVILFSLLTPGISSAATTIDLTTFSMATGTGTNSVATTPDYAVMSGTADIFNTVPVGLYSFEWRFVGNVSDDPVNNDFAYVVGGDAFTMLADIAGVRGSGGDSGWHTFTVDTSATGLLKFAVANVGGDITNSDFYIKNVMAIPEPETYAMLLAGLGLIGFSVRSKKERVLCS